MPAPAGRSTAEKDGVNGTVPKGCKKWAQGEKKDLEPPSKEVRSQWTNADEGGCKTSTTIQRTLKALGSKKPWNVCGEQLCRSTKKCKERKGKSTRNGKGVLDCLREAVQKKGGL